MNVSLSAEAAEVINEKLQNGEFRSAEEVVDEALRVLRDSKDPLQQKQTAAQFFVGLKGVRPPAHWPPQFGDFEPLAVEGELPSRQLINERR
ncbi:MAG: ribbon-helix-helix domain-containing protein [Bryobacteraceae bacterium]